MGEPDPIAGSGEAGLLDALASMSRSLSGGGALGELLGPALRELSERLGLALCALALLDRRRDLVTVEAAHGLRPGAIRRAWFLPGEGITGRVVQTGEPIVVAQLDREPRFLDRTGALREGGARAMVCAPVRAAGQCLGALSAYRTTSDPALLERDLKVLRVVAAMLAPAVLRRAEQLSPPRPWDQEDPGHRGARPPSDLIGRSKVMQAVYDLVDQVARTQTTALLLGESGTGKELIANALHHRSPRSGGPFVKVNCAALPEALVESELFGHERGAFTGAHRMKPGRFERARGGTIFLDEIGDLSPAVQVKLLRVLQERVFERVGGVSLQSADVRVIAATSRDLEAMVRADTFRLDLYYRLNVFPIRLPPLRERRADILLLADHFVEAFNRAHGRQVRRIATPAIDMLMAYHWPGNVRELENCVERAVLLARDDVILGHHLPPTLQTAEASGTALTGGLKDRMDAFERDLIVDALKSTRGNMAAAARELHVTERIMGLRVKRHGIDPRRFKRPKGG